MSVGGEMTDVALLHLGNCDVKYRQGKAMTWILVSGCPGGSLSITR